jgi:multidrug efflux pump subunit AcrA (membrane-fusion protein)
VWKWLLGIGLFLVLSCVGSGYWAYSSGKLKPLLEKFNPDSKVTTVRVEQVTRGTLVRSINAPGLIEPRTKVQISAQVAARIIAIPIRENQPVKKGDVVVRLDPTEFAATVEAAQANVRIQEARLQNAQAAMANASVELGRKRELFSTKDISKAELDSAELQYAQSEGERKSAQSAIENAQANVRRAEKDLSNCVISAPFDGVITKRNAEVGELVLVGIERDPGDCQPVRHAGQDACRRSERSAREAGAKGEGVLKPVRREVFPGGGRAGRAGSSA